MPNEIIIKNANVNNLKHFSVRIPRDKLVVLTGLSGSGKSFTAKREIVNALMSTRDEVILLTNDTAPYEKLIERARNIMRNKRYFVRATRILTR